MTDEPTVVTTRRRTAVARAFGLKGEGWMRHANPASVWSRFAVLPLLALAIWSRDWIGWWFLAAVGLALVWMVVNPLFFREPASTRNWASRGVLGERIWTEGDKATFPPEFRSKVPAVAMGFQAAALVPLVYGLIELNVLSVVVGIVFMQCAKAWYIDRMVLLFETMKDRDPDYAQWDR